MLQGTRIIEVEGLGPGPFAAMWWPIWVPM